MGAGVGLRRAGRAETALGFQIGDPALFCKIFRGFERRNIGLTRQELKTKLKPEILSCKVVMALDHIEQLETKVMRLIEKHERVKKEKESVEKRLQQRESEWHHLKGQIRQYERERVELKEKLDKILGQFASLELPD